MRIHRSQRVPALRNCRIGVIGLGYVGLPLAAEFGKHLHTVGFDIKPQRIAELKAGKDSTLELTRAELKSATRLRFTSRTADLKTCRVFIVTVPTPIDELQAARPDTARQGERDGGAGPEEGRRRRLRIDGLSRLHRRGLRADPREASRDSSSTRISLPATARSASTPATRSTG